MRPVAIDALGGDHAPGVAVAGAVAAARELASPIVLVGQEEAIRSELRKHRLSGLPVGVHHAAEVVTMDDNPIEAMRRKRGSSIQVGLELVRSGEVGAFVSAGNSGAVMASAVRVLGRLPGVGRPAIAVELPSRSHPVTLLDAGANVDPKPEHLIEFAVMGDVIGRTLRGIPSPRIGIVSNGEEPSKGTEATRLADRALRRMPLSYVGYVEGRDLMAGKVDVAVTDGFTGNVILKTIEGFGSFLFEALRKTSRSNVLTMFGFLCARGAFKKLHRLVDHEAVGGAPLVGVNGVTIIAHGGSSPRAIQNAIRVGAEAAAADIPGRILEALNTASAPGR